MSSCAIYPARAAKGWLPWGLLVPFLGLAFVAATVGGSVAVLQHAHLIDAQENPIGLTGFMAFLLLPFGALGLVVIAWVRFVERRPLASIGLAAGHPLRTFLGGLLAGVAMAVIIVTGIWLVGGFGVGASAEAFGSWTAIGSIATLLAGFSLQSSVEELLFRGWMLSAIANKFGIATAVVLTSAVFVLFHHEDSASWLFAINVVLFALFACCWAISTGNIWGVMGWHAAWNWLFATGFELRVTGLDAHLPALLVKLVPHGPDYLTGGALGPEGGYMCSLVLLGGIGFFALRARWEGCKTKESG
jgi:membrane protease YdiL (CAAX protease family)